MRALHAIFFLLLFGLGVPDQDLAAQSQGEVSFSAYTDAKEVLQGTYFEVIFTLKNGEGSGFKAPDFRDFNVLSGH